jgi:UDP-glucuronate 4-epimerase
VHLAARAGVRASIAQPEIFTSVNVQGTINLLEASRLHKVGHFVFGSSSSVYGAHDTMPFREEGTVYRPISPYAATKLAGEFYCHTYHHLYDLPVTVLRFFTVYGPRQRPEMAIHRFTTLIDQGKEVPIYGDGTTKRDYTYITDIIDGIVEAMKRDKGFDVFNLGNAESVELHRVVYIIARALGNKAKVSHLPPQLGDVPVTCADITKAQALLGYQPRVKIDDGIWRFVHWYERTEVTPRVEREREGAWGS